jgi:hypothetical protein
MSEIAFEEYFPMAEGPGAGADWLRWRKMAMLWSDSGVVLGVGESPPGSVPPNTGLYFQGWWEPGSVLISSGAVWINGFYAENLVGKTVITPGDDGTIMGVLDPYTEELRLEWGPGLHGDMDRFNTRTDHYWQIGLWELNGYGNTVDQRRFVPPPRQEPPLVEVPEWVPKPYFRSYTGSGIVQVSTTPQWVWLQAIGTGQETAFVPGRNYRVTFFMNSPFGRLGANWGRNSYGECIVGDSRGELPRVRAYHDSLQPGAYQLPARTATIAAPALDASAYAGIIAWLDDNFFTDQWLLDRIRIEVTDIGHGAVAAG